MCVIVVVSVVAMFDVSLSFTGSSRNQRLSRASHSTNTRGTQKIIMKHLWHIRPNITIVMMMATVLVALSLSHSIKHVVVLMEENRSFDHLFGFRKGVNGLNGNEFNYISQRKPSLGKVFVNRTAINVAPCDPDHSFPATTRKIFGELGGKPTMSGFVEFERSIGNSNTNYCEVMNSFSVDHLPVMNALADEFLLFDEFFASMPGPTWPNRLFFLCGTSGGLTETVNPWYQGEVGRLFPQRTIFDQIEEAGLTWKNYVNDTPWELFVETVASHPENVVTVSQFFEDARRGTLPSFSYINPRAGVNVSLGLGSNDMHPDHDVALSEAFYKDIYEALRAGPAWNDTLFIITFDEHGGFYDHVPTPLGVPPPGDNLTSYPDPDFFFDRLGIRIPTLLISPWVQKGRVESKPTDPRSMPQNNSQYELTSIMASVRKLFNITSLGPLTRRDAWAATFDHLLETQEEPRTDCPTHLPMPMPPTSASLEAEASRPLNSLQKHIATVHGQMSGWKFPDHLHEQRHVSQWLEGAYVQHHQRATEWKRSKTSPIFTVRCEPFIGLTPNFVASNWTVSSDPNGKQGVMPSSSLRTLSIEVHNKAANTTSVMCLDSSSSQLGDVVGLSLCFPQASVTANGDRFQKWVAADDVSLRPFVNQSLCLTSTCIGNVANFRTDVTLQLCNGSLAQRWGYYGAAVGSFGPADGGWLAQDVWALVVDFVQ